MEAHTARLGRLFVLRFHHGEELIQTILDFAREQEIRAAWIQLLGALRQGQLVVGPQEPQIPPVPVWQNFSGGWEIVALGNLFWEEDSPKLHLHGTLGRGTATLAGCLRLDNEVYLVVEALILELLDLPARRRLDPASGLAMLEFSP